MSHNIFLQKAEYYGFRGNSLKLLKSYLSDRKQCVTHNDAISSEVIMEHGVPQGSILGSLFFVIYVNDLPNTIQSLCLLYADDTTIATHSTVPETAFNQLQECQTTAKEWFAANELELNEDKTKNITFTSSRIAGESQNAKLLGLHLDSRLTWKQHCTEIALKLNRAIYAIRRIRKIINTEVGILCKFPFYYDLCNRNMRSFIPCKKIYLLQKKAVRALEAAPPRTTCRPLFIKYKILTLTGEYIIKLLVETQKKKNTFQTRS